MTAHAVVSCVLRLQKESRNAHFWMDAAIDADADTSKAIDDYAKNSAVQAAHEARVLLRLTGELEAE